jgi:hypothetical protein
MRKKHRRNDEKMINEDRVILMTRMQSYENNTGKKSIAIANYFRSDYLGFQMLKSVIYSTIAMIILFVGYVLYDFESFMKNIYQVDLLAYFKHIFIIYLVCIGVYALLTYVIYALRYTMAKKSLKNYYNNLKKLNAMYSQE